jgi:hypothetical protein
MKTNLLNRACKALRDNYSFLMSRGQAIPDEVITVGPSGDYRTIQAAIDYATMDGMKGKNIDIFVQSGSYNEALNIPDCDSGGLTAMMGSIADAGTLRIIGSGYVRIYQGDAATAPTITVLRPAVKLINLTVVAQSAQSAIYAVCENNTAAGGEYDNGFAAGLEIIDCNVRGGGPDDAPAANSIGIYLYGALKTKVINTLVECFVTGIKIYGSSVNFALYNVIECCDFDGNTNDICADAVQYSYIKNCNFYNASATTHLTTLGAQANTGNKIIGGSVMEANLTKFAGVGGFGAVGVLGAAAQPLLYDTDLTS